MERKGKQLAVLADGHPRRLADGRNAWRKMDDEQRATFVRFICEFGSDESADEILRLLGLSEGGA